MRSPGLRRGHRRCSSGFAMRPSGYSERWASRMYRPGSRVPAQGILIGLWRPGLDHVGHKGQNPEASVSGGSDDLGVVIEDVVGPSLGLGVVVDWSIAGVAGRTDQDDVDGGASGPWLAASACWSKVAHEGHGSQQPPPAFISGGEFGRAVCRG